MLTLLRWVREWFWRRWFRRPLDLRPRNPRSQPLPPRTIPYRDALAVLLSRLPVREPELRRRSHIGALRQLRAAVKRQRRRERNLRWYPARGVVHA